MNLPSIRYPALLCLVLATAGGCNSTEQANEEKDGHGHSHDHDHAGDPKSLRAAITQLRGMWADISTAMDNNEPDAAHDSLHEVGHVLESMPDLAAETDLPESEWNEVKTEVEKLFEEFGNIDSAFHKQDGDKVGAYESAKTAIDEGIAALEAKLQSLAEELSNDEHGHEDHEDLDNKKSAAAE